MTSLADCRSRRRPHDRRPVPVRAGILLAAAALASTTASGQVVGTQDDSPHHLSEIGLLAKASATPNPNCILIVPPAPLTAAAAANAAIRAGELVMPPLGTAVDGRLCPSVRDFSVVDQDQSDTLLTKYLALPDGRTAQFVASTPPGPSSTVRS